MLFQAEMLLLKLTTRELISYTTPGHPSGFPSVVQLDPSGKTVLTCKSMPRLTGPQLNASRSAPSC
jgi:hypothetical protein